MWGERGGRRGEGEEGKGKRENMRPLKRRKTGGVREGRKEREENSFGCEMYAQLIGVCHICIKLSTTTLIKISRGAVSVVRYLIQFLAVSAPTPHHPYDTLTLTAVYY